MALKRMDNVGIVVDDLGGTIDFFRELGLELEGLATIGGEGAGRVTGLGDQRVEIAMMRTPDGHGRLELSRFLTPPAVADHRNAPVNALGYLRVMFAVDDLDDTLDRLREHGAQLVDEVVQYEDVYRLCYVRGPEGILIGPPVASSTSPRLGCRSKARATAITTANRSPVASRSASGRYPRAAEACFATPRWPAERAVPQVSIEFDVGDAAAVGATAEELEKAGYELLHPARTEPWGQTVARLQSPEGAIVGISYIPMLHDEN